MSYRLSVNLGATYLAWCLLDLDSAGNVCRLRDMGLRVFPDGREPRGRNEPLAHARGDARRQRRRRDRLKSRQRRLMEFMIKHGLMPGDEATRKDFAAERPCTSCARGLWMKNFRCTNSAAPFFISINAAASKATAGKIARRPDTGAIKAGIAELERALGSGNARTLGEYLAQRRKHRQAVRARSRTQDRKTLYDFFPSRALCEQELDAIIDKQRAFYPELLDTIGDELKRIILYQRPLKPVTPDRCTFEPTELRARAAYPAVQAFHILNQVNALEVVNPSDTCPALTEEERTIIIDKLQETDELTFPALRKLLKRGKEVKFNLEFRARLSGDATGCHLSHPARFGARWHGLAEQRQNAAVDIILC